ncbi:hypothetical protein Y032_0146g2533 [Ancylostoma ceylanicum]|uniref:Uncharacterized protein n=1 Tax=Ancylostoma ceylanicum TaxID=53326 RepID=A0A016T2K5_9BILA|nr:hypothetical protein Y032_0146g2533 [Ancylostoma ceylanicum]
MCKTIKPPNLTLPKFYGKEEEFPEFWAVFETLVHKNNTLTTIEKMLLLKDSLKGKSDRAIQGMQIIPQNYECMIETLMKKHSNKPTNRARIIQQLMDLQPANKTSSSCTFVYDKISMFINQMVSAGQDIRRTTDAMWTENTLQKFPHDIVERVLIRTREQHDITIDELTNEIDAEIAAKSYVQARTQIYHSKKPSSFYENRKK